MKSPHQNVLLNLPTDPAERKAIPVMTGVLDYFPAAIAEVAKISKLGNDQHNPGEPLHWARGKSTDQADTIIRHLMARGTRDTDKARHSAKAAWRVLALLQEEIETEAGFDPNQDELSEPQKDFRKFVQESEDAEELAQAIQRNFLRLKTLDASYAAFLDSAKGQSCSTEEWFKSHSEEFEN